MGYGLIGEFSGWEHRVFRYEVGDPAPRELANLSWARRPGGVFFAAGFNAEGPDLEPTRIYDAVVAADRLLHAATGVDVDNTDSLLRFVNEWGLLGLAQPDSAVQFFDSVFLTRESLKSVQHLARMLPALRHGRLNSDVLPTNDELRSALPGLPHGMSTSVRKRALWQFFAARLDKELLACSVKPSLTPTGRRDHPGGLVPTWRPGRLIDVLFLTLWQTATDPGQDWRTCPRCARPFYVSATNRKRKFCSPECKNLFNVNKHRRRQTRRRKGER